MEWLAKKHEVASWRTLEAVAPIEVNRPVRDKGKKKIVNRMEEEKRCKFQADPLVEKETMVIEAKRKQCDKQIVQRQREKLRMEETKKELHELNEEL